MTQEEFPDGYLFSSDIYIVNDESNEIIVEEIPLGGIAEGEFAGGLSLKGKFSYRMNLSSGWVHEGNTVDILDESGTVVASYTIREK